MKTNKPAPSPLECAAATTLLLQAGAHIDAVEVMRRTPLM